MVLVDIFFGVKLLGVYFEYIDYGDIFIMYCFFEYVVDLGEICMNYGVVGLVFNFVFLMIFG